MLKGNRIKKTKTELREDLGTQLKILRLSCKNYDEGNDFAGITISITLRILLHDQGKNTRSLLDQLGIRDKRFYDSAGPLDPRNLLPEMPLVSMRYTSESGISEAKFIPSLTSNHLRPVPFHAWWTAPVVRDRSRRTMSRKDLVCNIADTDGGAHVDPGLDEIYHGISRKKTLEAMQIYDESSQVEFSNRIELACLRQIAFETILSIERHAPGFKLD